MCICERENTPLCACIFVTISHSVLWISVLCDCVSLYTPACTCVCVCVFNCLECLCVSVTCRWVSFCLCICHCVHVSVLLYFSLSQVLLLPGDRQASNPPQIVPQGPFCFHLSQLWHRPFFVLFPSAMYLPCSCHSALSVIS